MGLYVELIVFILGIVAFYYVLRYNLHMFQLNGYKNDEHFHWLIQKSGKQALLGVVLITAIANLLYTNVVMSVVCGILLLIVIKYYGFLKSVNTKKKLVFTMRVKRLIISEIVISGLLCFICDVMFNSILFGLKISIVLQPIITIFANIINAPIEKAVNNYYINDAKRILKQNSNITVIGVTGSYGKTSIKYYLNTLLQEKYNVLMTPESYNTPMGIVKTIRGSMKSTHEIFICEMGARRVGQIKEICDIVHPEHGVITSIGPQHLETFHSIDNIKSTKFELADSLPENGMIFLNRDNEYIEEKSKGYSNIIFYGTNKDKEGYKAFDVELSQLGTKFSVVAPTGETCEFKTRLIGEHNVINILGAIAVANSMGISLQNLKVPVRRIQAVPHRMQLIERGAVTIIDDAFNSNPVGSKAAVETLKLFDGLRIMITPGMVELGEKEEDYNYQFGMYAADCCDYIFLVGKKRGEVIRKGAISKGFENNRCILCDTLEEAMSKATSLTSEKHKYILLENDLPDNY